MILKLNDLRTKVPKHQFEKLKNIVSLRHTSMTILLSLMIDKELEGDKPFDFDLTLAGEEVEEYAYAEQASKLIDFMVKYDKPLKMTSLLMLRYDIGIPDRDDFLGSFNELLVKKMIEGKYAKGVTQGELTYKPTGTFSADDKYGRKKAKKAKRFELESEIENKIRAEYAAKYGEQ